MAKLTTKGRKQIAKKNFAIKEKAPESGSYPINDLAHARAALRMMHNASPAEQKRIMAAIRRKYPELMKDK